MASFRFEKKENIGNRTMPFVHLIDNYMSFRAKGILSLLYAIDADAELSADEIATAATDTRGVVMSALKELQLLGYIRRTMKRDEYRG